MSLCVCVTVSEFVLAVCVYVQGPACVFDHVV